ncbi:hypothetical protein HMPREF3034_01887 [Prevotella sp. DNF00663]|uniref:hypothetical protein n=1 Tax=Prevotella sp. DNF00663 TaxID=1384078 RepID=UPI000797740C|nr:hypothetical protein [Prevotella sp. DNF00663]KXB81498.1 hypothetical protein HMPREF3034_01887 [Prevotella sp. DNF00663]
MTSKEIIALEYGNTCCIRLYRESLLKEQKEVTTHTDPSYTWQASRSDSLLTVWYLPSMDSLQMLCYLEYSIYNLY